MLCRLGCYSWGVSEHFVGVGGLGGDGLDDVPVLDDPAVLDPEDVDDGLAVVLGGHREVVVEDDQAVFGDARLRWKEAWGAWAKMPSMSWGKMSGPSGAVGLCWV